MVVVFYSFEPLNSLDKLYAHTQAQKQRQRWGKTIKHHAAH